MVPFGVVSVFAKAMAADFVKEIADAIEDIQDVFLI